MSLAETKIEKARVRMVYSQPFFSCFAHRLLFIEDNRTQTMATDGKAIYWNRAWVEERTIQELEFVIAHECAHCAWGHHIRRKGRVVSTWNEACDYAINVTLKKAGLTFPEGGLINLEWDKLSAEQIFLKLKAEQKDQEQDDQQGEQGDGQSNNDQQINNPSGASGESDDDGSEDSGESGADSSSSQGEDDSQDEQDNGNSPSESSSNEGPAKPVPAKEWGEVWDATNDDGSQLSEAEKQDAERQLASQVFQAAQAEKKAGQGKGDWVNEILNSNRGADEPWYEYLKDALVDTVSNEQTYNRPDRRFLGRGQILPSYDKNPNGTLAIAVDVSYSLLEEELKVISGHVEDIIDTVQPEKIIVIYCHEIVCAVDEFDLGDDFKLRIPEKGGTEFNPVFNYIHDNCLDPTALIYFTDGYGYVGPTASSYLKFEEPDYPVFWATNHVSPTFYGCEEFGEVIEVS